MKKLYFLLILFGISLGTYCQDIPEKTTGLNNQDVGSYLHKLKGDGQIFYYEDFDWENPDDIKGWSLGEGWELFDPDDIGFNWLWMLPDSLIWVWTEEPPFRSSTADNGFLCLPLNWYNDLIGDEDAYLDVNNSIGLPTLDCSSHSSVILRFEHNFMSFGSSFTMQIEVSSDGGAHWAYYDCSEGAGHKDRPKDAAPGEAVIFEVNISEAAAGMESVIIRIKWAGTDCYYWEIDDLSLSEAYDNDLQIQHVSMEFDRGDEEVNESIYYMIPKSQIGGGGFTNFEGGVRNFGEFDQIGVEFDVEILKNKISVFHSTSEATDMPTSEVDTLYVYDSYHPVEYGHYQINMKYESNSEDNNPGDNLISTFFHITDSVYSRSDDSSEAAYSLGYELYDEYNMWYDYTKLPIFEDCEANSISVFIQGGQEGIDFRFVIFDPNVEDGETPIERIGTDVIAIDSAMHNTWLTLDVDKDGEGEFLLAGNTYYVGMQYWFDNEDMMITRNNNIYIGNDLNIKLKDKVSGYSTDLLEFDDYTRNNLMIRLNINNNDNIIDGISENNNINKLEQNYPNPFSRNTEISYQISDVSEVIIDICDITGRKVYEINEGVKQAGKHKVGLNANELSPGVYYYTLNTKNFRTTRKMVLSR